LKKIAIVAVALLFLAGSSYLLLKRKPAEKAETPLPTAVVERGDIRLSVASSGRVVPNLEVEIKCKASGEIVKLPFDVSDAVRKGDLLLELDPADELRRVRQAKASLDSSKARVVIAKENLAMAEQDLVTERLRAETAVKSARARAEDVRQKADRVKELLAAHLSSKEEYETAETTAVQAASDLEMAKVAQEGLDAQERAIEQKRQQIVIAQSEAEADSLALDLAKQSLADTRVVSPMDGVVTKRSVQIGQIISSGISNEPQP